MKPEIWGSNAWVFIHAIALEYPENPTENEKYEYYTFFKSLGPILPCANCKNNYKRHFDENPLTYKELESRVTLFRWSVNLHNAVSKDLGKKQYTYQEALDIFKERVNPKSNWMSNAVIVILLILALVICYYLFVSPEPLF